MKTNLLFLIPFFILTSCAQWSEEDSEKYIEHCEKSKFNKEECDCHLEKVKTQFNSFEEMSENEAILSKIWEECLSSKNDQIEPESEPEPETIIEEPTEEPNDEFTEQPNDEVDPE